jgi:hypothetical protein
MPSISKLPGQPTLPIEDRVAALEKECFTLQQRLAAVEQQVAALNKHTHEEYEAGRAGAEMPLSAIKWDLDHAPPEAPFWKMMIKLIAVPPPGYIAPPVGPAMTGPPVFSH